MPRGGGGPAPAAAGTAASIVAAWRVSGAGNDFLALAEPAADPPPANVRAWCRRGLSLGADGLFVLRRGDGGRVVMTHFNADGGRAELCINGTRCAARLAFHLGWARGETTLVTGAGPILARDAGPDAIALELAAPGEPQALTVEVAGGEHRGWRSTVGVPHFVLPWSASLASAPVASLGPALRAHAAFGTAGTNVDFVRYVAPRHFELRSYERGVEAETLACGTGVLAAAAVGRRLGLVELPARALTAGGFTMEVGVATQDTSTPDGSNPDGSTRDRGRRWSLTGDARLLARLELLPAAARLPPPPSWS